MSHNESNEKGSLQHDAEHEKPHAKLRVKTYFAILFAAAFLLLLLTYFMQQRTNEQAINSLTDSVATMQSVGDLVHQNEVLHSQLDVLEAASAKLESQLQAAQNSSTAWQEKCTAAQGEVDALATFCEIQARYAKKDYDGARSLMDADLALPAPALEANLTAISDRLASGGSEDALYSPIEQYNRLMEKLY